MWSTYNAHPASLAAAVAATKLYDELHILENIESLQPTIAERRSRLMRHASCHDVRVWCVYVSDL